MNTQPSLHEFSNLVGAAWARRHAYHARADLNCYRTFHGYEEGYPGLSVDRYGSCVIVNKKVALPYADEDLAAALNGAGAFESIVVKTHQRLPEFTARRVRCISGRPVEGPLVVNELGVSYLADHSTLHSNGLYLDARPARQWLRKNSDSRRVLNLFAHTGSLGVAARLGGAKEVVYVDKQRALLERVLSSYELNGLKPDERGLLVGDIYYHLPRAIKWGQKFSAIVLDPPPIVAPSRRVPEHRPEGQDFAKLIGLCCKLLDDGAWLLCLYHAHGKTHDAHDQAIVAASEGRLAPIWRSASDDDFPESDPDRSTRMTAFHFKH